MMVRLRNFPAKEAKEIVIDVPRKQFACVDPCLLPVPALT